MASHSLAILKHTFDQSEEELSDRWLENPYFQHFSGEEFFCHERPFDRPSITCWRQRMGEERIAAILQETLATAVKTEAIRPTDLTGVIIDATVQEKTSACPNDARLAQRARERLVRLAKAHGLKLRQSYVRVGKLAMTKHQRYAHAKQYKRATSCLRTLKTYLGRTIRYIERGIGKARAGAP